MSGLMKPSIHWLFACALIALLLEHLGTASPPLVFFSVALAIIPVAHLISTSTEHLAADTVDAVGGLLNATFGNLPELIIVLVALEAWLYSMVAASLVGAILFNLLLALGLSFFLRGLRYHGQRFNSEAASVYGSMMFIAVMSLALPSVCAATFGHDAPRIGILVLASVIAAVLTEVLVGAVEGTREAFGLSTPFIGIVLLASVGGAAEGLSAIAMGRANRMDLSLGIAMGSCIQVSLSIAPVIVFASYFVGPKPFQLLFSGVAVALLFMSVMIGTIVAARDPETCRKVLHTTRSRPQQRW